MNLYKVELIGLDACYVVANGLDEAYIAAEKAWCKKNNHMSLYGLNRITVCAEQCFYPDCGAMLVLPGDNTENDNNQPT